MYLCDIFENIQVWTFFFVIMLGKWRLLLYHTIRDIQMVLPACVGVLYHQVVREVFPMVRVSYGMPRDGHFSRSKTDTNVGEIAETR